MLARRAGRAPPRQSDTAAVVAGVAAVVVLGTAAYAARGMFAHKSARASLGPKTQLTVSGGVHVPAISPDGKQLAFVDRTCGAGGCTYSVVVQDVGGTTTRSILENATAAYGLEWSPDRRNLMFNGTVADGTGPISFPRSAVRRIFSPLEWRRSTLTAIHCCWAPRRADRFGLHDRSGRSRRHPPRQHRRSRRRPGPGGSVGHTGNALDRDADLASRRTDSGRSSTARGRSRIASSTPARAAASASSTRSGCSARVTRRANRSCASRSTVRRGHLATTQDTMVTALFTNFSVTADGSKMVMDEGTLEYGVWAMDFPAMVQKGGRLTNEGRIARASNAVDATVSPDGGRLLFGVESCQPPDSTRRCSSRAAIRRRCGNAARDQRHADQRAVGRFGDGERRLASGLEGAPRSRRRAHRRDEQHARPRRLDDCRRIAAWRRMDMDPRSA